MDGAVNREQDVREREGLHVRVGGVGARGLAVQEGFGILHCVF